ncbi:MAG TPA: hypothetical protein VHL58_10545 [Thermoanaerobaculia bacterium]|nr:hypothetical protein [Thermoanaerobaculia bacterium]
MFALLTIFGVLLVAPIALIGVVLTGVGFILKMVIRIITMPFLLIGVTVKAAAFLILIVIAVALVLPLLMGAAFVIGVGLLAAWGTLSLLAAVLGQRSVGVIKL